MTVAHDPYEGEFFWIKQRDPDGQPLDVEVLAPEDVVTVRTEDGEIIAYMIKKRQP